MVWKKWRRGLSLLMCLVLVPQLSACWDSTELNERAVVAAIGIDRSEQQRYEVSFQIIVADEIASSKARGTSPVIQYRETGNTIMEATRKAARKVPRRISLSHVRAVVISEDLAREGIGNLLDFLERDTETRLTMRVLIARNGQAKNVLSTMTAIGRIPANDITGKLENSERVYGETYVVNIDDVIRRMNVAGSGPVIAGVELTGKQENAPKKDNVDKIIPDVTIFIHGASIFRRDKLVRWLDEKEAMGLSIIRNKIKSRVSSLTCGKEPDAMIVETDFAQSDLNVSFQGGEPVFTFVIKQTGMLSEVNCPLDLTGTDVIEAIQHEWTKDTHDLVMSAVRASQHSHTDVIGLGEALERKNPKYWSRVSNDWDKKFADSTVQVKVISVIKHTQTRSSPFSERSG
ncbi:Ger(x)C family spore germination protein [Paenibacillus massiliensis]|uniref:Ger(x)C family spore germination protein n=1 Tax=Paenibacillus massiliensis TaxID=225917 RepID=UPI0003A07EDD|nr:Ger(x)C family spore germination protein [Paenibacillus massiliensis]